MNSGTYTNYTEWLEWSWFKYETLKSFHWDNPWILYFILFIPVLFFTRWLFHFKSRQKFKVALYSNEVKGKSIVQLIRLIPYSVEVLILTLFIIALARPQRMILENHNQQQGIDILIALDISESMQLQDLKPTRLVSAKKLLTQFVDQRTTDRMGIVLFAGDAYTYCPVTYDHDLLKVKIDNIRSSLIANQGTAIGMAIGVATNRLQSSTAQSKVILLISDGDNTAGVLEPNIAAQLAKEYQIKIYSISIGKQGKTTLSSNQDQQVISPPDDKMLREVSRLTNGQFFKANNNKDFEKCLNELNHLEKSTIQKNNQYEYEDVYRVYLFWGIVLFIVLSFMRITFLNNFLED